MVASVQKLAISGQTREQILSAANSRFQQFGYGKTTMAEIADDCGMSAGNLYRYFVNKQEIAAILAQRCLQEEESALRRIIDQSNLTVSERFEGYILQVLHHTHHHWSKMPRLDELVSEVCATNLELVNRHMSNKTKLLTELLLEGNRKRDFSISDPEKTACAILAAITVVDVPFFMHMRTLAEFEDTAKMLSRILLNGLRTR